MEDLVSKAVERALDSGASYADARWVSRTHQNVVVKDGAVRAMAHSESAGVGVRVTADGAWGFASTSRTDPQAVAAAAELATRIARASATTVPQPVELAETEICTDRVSARVRVNPLDVGWGDRAELLLECDRLMRAAADLAVSEASMGCLLEEKWFASSEGASIYQERVEVGGGLTATATAPGRQETQRRSYPSSHGGAWASRGYEQVEELELAAHAEETAKQAVALTEAPHCPEGTKDLILEGSQLALQLHESCGHPIELDRVFGTEASYAGMSFLTPDKLGTFRYGSEQVNIVSDATLPHGLGSFKYDDEGIPARRAEIVRPACSGRPAPTSRTLPPCAPTATAAFRSFG